MNRTSDREPTFLVVQHEDQCPPAMIEVWLAEVGVACDVRTAHRGADVPAHLRDHQGLVVLGGHMSANDDADHAWLSTTKSLIADTTRAGMPFLGVCLGHQLAGVAMGGQVRPNPAGPRHTLLQFTPSTEGRTDPLTSVLEPGEEVLHWNTDVVSRVPEGATVLASAPDGSPAALRYGERSWGVQFHPEVTPGQVASWSPGADREAELAVIADLRARLDELHAPWRRLTHRFAALALEG